ncbi:MAG TPA: hypothetical protein VLV48_08580 [Thermoanaerobaculia bacterium]|nr:hypothetical protein [Thermoanaerobaculia bacterium]
MIACTGGARRAARHFTMEEENVMIDISLTREEREILSEVLDRTIGELKREIVFTDRRAFRDDLELRRALLERLSDALHGRALAV